VICEHCYFGESIVDKVLFLVEPEYNVIPLHQAYKEQKQRNTLEYFMDMLPLIEYVEVEYTTCYKAGNA
jgi:hypothetical protein